MTVTVYTKTACPACRLTKLHLERRGIEYVEAPIDAAAERIAVIGGISSAPIVMAGSAGSWGGYRPDRIDALLK